MSMKKIENFLKWGLDSREIEILKPESSDLRGFFSELRDRGLIEEVFFDGTMPSATVFEIFFCTINNYSAIYYKSRFAALYWWTNFTRGTVRVHAVCLPEYRRFVVPFGAVAFNDLLGRHRNIIAAMPSSKFPVSVMSRLNFKLIGVGQNMAWMDGRQKFEDMVFALLTRERFREALDSDGHCHNSEFDFLRGRKNSSS
jgi:hypothetical protein